MYRHRFASYEPDGQPAYGDNTPTRFSRPFPASLVSLVKPAFVFLERVSGTRVIRDYSPKVLRASLAQTPGAEESSVDVDMTVRYTMDVWPPTVLRASLARTAGAEENSIEVTVAVRDT